MHGWHEVMTAQVRVTSATCKACACLHRFKTYNIRQNLVFVYVGKSSTKANSLVSGFSILGGTVLASTILVNANPFEPTQASCSALAALHALQKMHVINDWQTRSRRS